MVEILLFMTPRHRADIVASLVASLNGAYLRFMRRNPGFQVRVSSLCIDFESVPNGAYLRFMRRNLGFQVGSTWF